MLLFVFFALVDVSLSYTCTGALYAWPSNEPVKFIEVNNEEQHRTYFKTDYFAIYVSNLTATLCRKDDSCEHFYYEASNLYHRIDSYGNIYTFNTLTNTSPQSGCIHSPYSITLLYNNCTN